ncbi:PRA1 family protein F2-like [Silene latifolia]|uniref:PRA1 family protein F2-like n=1 Tax=Silene latifolia TaxID=37657 RepID=UPI003D7730DA
MTTTYGTIPTTNPNQSTTRHDLITTTTTQLQTHLATRRPWPELVSLKSLSFPPSFSVATSRATANLSYFRTNYALIILITLFLSLISHPISLIVFLIMFAAWLFLYFLRQTPLTLAGRVVDDNVVLVVLGVATVLFLLFTDVTVNIVVGVAVGVVLVLVHAAIREIDDLHLRVGSAADRMPLQDTASAGYSS